MALPFVVRGAALALAMSAAFIQSAAAEKWPGKSPVPGGAVAARAIASQCAGVLKAGETDELTAYLSRYLDTIGGRDPEMRERIATQVLPELEKAYLADYSKPGACDSHATEMAQDMLQRVRAVANNAVYWEQVLNPPVGPLDAVYSKAIGSVCEGTLTGADISNLESFVKEQMDDFARTSSEADTQTTWTHLKDSERKFADELSGQKMCTDAVRKDARDIAARVAAARQAR